MTIIVLRNGLNTVREVLADLGYANTKCAAEYEASLSRLCSFFFVCNERSQRRNIGAGGKIRPEDVGIHRVPSELHLCLILAAFSPTLLDST